MGWRALLGTGLRVGPGVGAHRPPEGASRHSHRAVREGDARQRQDLRRRAQVSAAQPRVARRARVPRAHGADRVRRPRPGPRRLRDDVRDDRALRLRLDRDVLRDAHGRGQHDHAPAHRGAHREVHKAPQQRQDRHPLLQRPRDRLALLVPDLLRRRPLQRRLQRAQEGFVDHVGRVRRLLRGPDHEPRLHRLRRPVRVCHRRRVREVAAFDLGRPRPQRQPVRADRGRRRRHPRRSDRRSRG